MLDRSSKSTTWGSLARRLRHAALVVALGAVFVSAFAAGLVIHIDTVPGRRLIARVTDRLVSGLIVSSLRIERIDRLSPSRLLVSRAALFDRTGRPVLAVEGLDARFGLLELFRGIFWGNEVRVRVRDVRAKRFALTLTRDAPPNVFTVQTALRPKHGKGPRKGAAKPIVVSLPRIAVDEAVVTTNQPGIERASARVRRVSAKLDVSPAGFALSLRSDDARATRLLSRDVTGRLRSELRLPGITRADLEARAGRVPVSATLEWRGDDLDVGMRSTELVPDALRDLFGSWPLVVPLRASARAAGTPESMSTSVEARAGTSRVFGTGSLAFAPEVAARLAVRGEGLNLRDVDARAPETAFPADATVSLGLSGEPRVDVTAALPEIEVGGTGRPRSRCAARTRATRSAARRGCSTNGSPPT